MSLIHQCNREEPLDAAVCPLHGVGIGRVECAFMLVDQYAVLGQRLIAVAVEFLGKEPFRMSKWICRIVDDNIVVIFTVSQKA